MGLCIKKFLQEKTVKLNDSYQVEYVHYLGNDRGEFYNCIGFSVPKMYEWNEEVHTYGNMSQKFLIPKTDLVQTLSLDLLEFIDDSSEGNVPFLRIRKYATNGGNHLTYSNTYKITDNAYTGEYSTTNNFSEITIKILNNDLTYPVYKYTFTNLKLIKAEPYEFSYDDESACKWTLTFTFETMTKEAIAPPAKPKTPSEQPATPPAEQPKTPPEQPAIPPAEQPKTETPPAEQSSETAAEPPAAQQPAEVQKEAKEEKQEEAPAEPPAAEQQKPAEAQEAAKEEKQEEAKSSTPAEDAAPAGEQVAETQEAAKEEKQEEAKSGTPAEGTSPAAEQAAEAQDAAKDKEKAESPVATKTAPEGEEASKTIVGETTDIAMNAETGSKVPPDAAGGQGANKSTGGAAAADAGRNAKLKQDAAAAKAELDKKIAMTAPAENTAPAKVEHFEKQLKAFTSDNKNREKNYQALLSEMKTANVDTSDTTQVVNYLNKTGYITDHYITNKNGLCATSTYLVAAITSGQEKLGATAGHGKNQDLSRYGYKKVDELSGKGSQDLHKLVSEGKLKEDDVINISYTDGSKYGHAVTVIKDKNGKLGFASDYIQRNEHGQKRESRVGDFYIQRHA